MRFRWLAFRELEAEPDDRVALALQRLWCDGLLARRNQCRLHLFAKQKLFQFRGGRDDRGLVRHDTEMRVEKNFVDSHGQSEVAFAFCHLLGAVRLMPRLKRIKYERLYLPDKGMAESYPNLAGTFARPIRWDLVEQQYDEMVKSSVAIKRGTASTEAILKRYNSYNVTHPTYKALAEVGKAEKTIFLCDYLPSLEIQREVHEGLNVVENWNATNDFICYGRQGELATNSREQQRSSPCRSSCCRTA